MLMSLSGRAPSTDARELKDVAMKVVHSVHAW